MLKVQFANGWIAPTTYTAKQLRWDNTGHPFDVAAVRKA